MSNEGPSQRGAEFQLQPVPASKRKRSTAKNERPRLWPAPAPTLVPAPRIAVRPSRLRRSLSVPNLKALCTTDLNATARHSIPMPARLAHGGGGGGGSSATASSLKGWSAVRPVRNYVERNGNVADPSSSTRTPPPWLSSVAKPVARLSVRSVRPCPIGPSTASTFAHVPQQAAVVTPSHLPPINSQTLRELDLHEILKNPQLRHDLVFDTDLQFRPNFDGERGRRKRDLNNKYWRAVQREIQTQCSCTSFYGNVELPCACASYRRRRGSGPMYEAAADMANKSASEARFFARIPVLIAELRYICMSILPSGTTGAASTSTCGAWPNSSTSSSMPDSASSTSAAKRSDASTTKSAAPSTTTNSSVSASPTTQFTNVATVVSPSMMGDEHALIAQCLDPVLIMQQLHYGVLDVVGLISTLGAILKQHCAPMRDPLIDSMVSTVMQHGDVTRSLRQCFEILELMKLDVANHQLSTSRIYLVETAPEFELRWLREQMTKGKMTLQRTMAWFSQHLTQQTQSSDCPSTRSATITAAFDEGLMDLIFDPPSQSTPQMAFAANLPSPSKFSSFGGLGPQNLASLAYPETFQFDAHRLLTFHGEVTDLTVVSMLLLLFRQLACSQQNLSQDPLPVLPLSTSSKSVTAKASAIASAQLAKVKSEIWTLLREAEAELSSCNNSNSRSVTTSPGGPTTPGGVAGRVLDSRLSSWRKVISDLVLQIAARAIHVQRMARATEADNVEQQGGECNIITHRPPTQATITLLTRWLETNLSSGGALFTLCRTRLRNNLTRLSKSDDCTSSIRATTARTTVRSVGRKRALSTLASDNFAVAASSKRCKTDKTDAIDVCSSSTLSQSSQRDDEDRNISESQQEDLEPFTAEIDLLAERIKKVKSFHLTVYRPFYECMAASQQDCAGDAASSSASTTSTNVTTTSSST